MNKIESYPNAIIKVLANEEAGLGYNQIRDALVKDEKFSATLKKDREGNKVIPKSTLFEHLKKLKDQEIIISRDGKYRLKELKDIESKLKKILLQERRGLTQKELIAHGFEESEIIGPLYKLLAEDIVEHVLVNETIRFALSPLGFSEAGHCPKCHEKFEDNENVIISGFQDRFRQFKTISIHSMCFRDTFRVDEEHKNKAFCAYCGLPIFATLLEVPRVTYTKILYSLYTFEYETIELMVKLYKGLETLNDQDSYALSALLEAVYKEKKMDIPEWLKQGYSHHKLFDLLEETLFEGFHAPLMGIFSDFRDLSIMGEANRFFQDVMKFRSGSDIKNAVSEGELPSDYNVTTRARDIWKLAIRRRERETKDLLAGYGELVGPASKIYASITPRVDPFLKRNAFDKLPNFQQAFAVKSGSKTYHPYCAEKQGLENHTHRCKEIKKGGEAKERR